MIEKVYDEVLQRELTEDEARILDELAERREDSTEVRLDRIEAKVNELDVKLTTILEAVDNIMSQAKPAIDQLVNSPLMKMITGGK